LKGVIPIGDNQCRFDYNKLERAIKAVIHKKLGDDNAPMVDSADRPGRVPTFVVANKGLHIDGPPTLFRSYQCQGYNADKCYIWEACRATSAAPTFFKPIKIAIPLPGATFVDGGLQHNNPAELALSEAFRIWTNAKRFCIVSIGTGRLKAVQMTYLQSTPQGSGSSMASAITKWIPGAVAASRVPSGLAQVTKIADACVQLVTNSDMVHQRLFKLSSSTDPEKRFPYHRFNVDRDMQDIGLQEWHRFEETAAHTAIYMDEGEAIGKKNNCVQDLINPKPLESR